MGGGGPKGVGSGGSERGGVWGSSPRIKNCYYNVITTVITMLLLRMAYFNWNDSKILNIILLNIYINKGGGNIHLWC